MELRLSSTDTASHWWVPTAGNEPTRGYLIPSIDFLELHATPTDALKDARLELSGDPTLRSFQIDVSLFLLKGLLSLLPTECFIPEEQLMITAIRSAYILESTARSALNMDSGAAVDELLTVLNEYLRLSSESFREMGVSCGFEVIEQLGGSPVIIGTLVAEFLVWYPVIFIDMFRYNALAVTISMRYTPDPKQVALATHWAKMEASWGKDDEAAMIALAEIMKIDPNYRETKEKLYALLIGKADRLESQGNREGALATIQRALEVNPSGAEAQQRLASYTAPPGWTLTLSADATQVPVGTQVSVIAETNRPLPDFISVEIGFFDRDLGRLRFGNAGLCVRIDQTRCRFPMTAEGEQTLGAVLIDHQATRANPNTPTEPLARSELLTITWGTGAPKPSARVDSRPSQTASLRNVDWRAVFSNDPSLSSNRVATICNVGEIDIEVKYKPDPSVNGYPWLNQISYGDLDQDGTEEALVPLLQSCTGGAEKSLIYQATPRGARVHAVGPGYGRGVQSKIVDGLVEVTEAIYRPGEARCCPTGGTRISRYKLTGNTLTEVNNQPSPATQPAARLTKAQLVAQLPLQTRAFDIEYLRSGDSFAIVIKQNPYEENKRKVDQWFIERGFDPKELKIYVQAYPEVEVPGQPARYR